MKYLRLTVFFFGLVVIFLLPLLRIGGHLFGIRLVTFSQYIISFLLFYLAVDFVTQKNDATKSNTNDKSGNNKPLE